MADEIYTRDFVNHGLHRNISLEEDQAAARFERTAFPDLVMAVNMMVAEGDLVTVLWTARGTHTRSTGGILATGVKIQLRGVTIWRIVDGKIHDEWTAFDRLHLIHQFVAQLKWPLIGLLCAVIILVWMLCRFVRRLRYPPAVTPAKATA